MRLAVRTSEAFNRADKMRKDGINPSLIFFSKTMTEPQIQHCVQILQADKVPDEKKVAHFTVLKDINDMLVSSTPQLHLMFYEEKIFKHDELPGFFNVPCHFDVLELKKYIQANQANCRKQAQKYLADQISYDDAHDHLSKLLGGGVEFTKKDERDHLDMERYGLALKHMIKYLRA